MNPYAQYGMQMPQAPGQGNWFTGYGGGFQQLPTMTPGQMGLQQQMQGGVGQGMGFYQGLLGGDQRTLDLLSAPLMRQFNREVVPGIAGRFAGGHSMRGSAFQNSLARAGTDLQTNIGQIQGNLLQSAAGGLTGMAGHAMQSPFQQVYRPQTPGVADYAAQAAGGFMGGAGMGFAKKIFGL